MKPLSVIMGVADLTCIILILLAYGFDFFIIILLAIMLYKGAVSFL